MYDSFPLSIRINLSPLIKTDFFFSIKWRVTSHLVGISTDFSKVDIQILPSKFSFKIRLINYLVWRYIFDRVVDVLWHINPSGLFKAKSCLYICIYCIVLLYLTIMSKGWFYKYIYIYLQNLTISIMVRVFAGDRGSIAGWVIPKIQKWYLMPPCITLGIIRYGSRVKWSNPGKE